MTCDEARAHTDRAGWDALPREERGRAARHLAACAACQAAMDEELALSGLVQEVIPPEVPAELTTRILERGRLRLPGGQPRAGGRRAMRIALAMIAVAMICGAAWRALAPDLALKRRDRAPSAHLVAVERSRLATWPAPPPWIAGEPSLPTTAVALPLARLGEIPTRLTISPDGVRVTAVGDQGREVTFEVAGGRQLDSRTLDARERYFDGTDVLGRWTSVPEGIHKARHSSDGQWLLTMGDRLALYWAGDAELVHARAWPVLYDLRADFAPGARVMAVLPGDDLVQVMELATGRTTWTFLVQDTIAQAMVFASDRLLAVGCGHGGIELRDVHERRLVARVRLPAPHEGVNCLAATPDGSRLIIGTTDGALLWVALPRLPAPRAPSDPPAARPPAWVRDQRPEPAPPEDAPALTFPGPWAGPLVQSRFVTFTSGRTHVVSADADGRLRIWSPDARRLLKSISLDGATAHGLVPGPSADEVTVATDRGLRRFDVARGVEAAVLIDRPVRRVVAASRTGRLAALADDRIWLVDAGVSARTELFAQGVLGLAISEGGDRLALRTASRLDVVDPATGKTVQSLAPPPPGEELAFAAGGHLLYAATSTRIDGIDVASGKMLEPQQVDPNEWATPAGLIGLPDGGLLVPTVNGVLCIARDGRRETTRGETCTQLALSTDATTMCASRKHSGLQVWDRATARALVPDEELRDTVYAIDLDPSGRFAQVSGRGATWVYDLGAGRQVPLPSGELDPWPEDRWTPACVRAFVGQGGHYLYAISEHGPWAVTRGPSGPSQLHWIDAPGGRLIPVRAVPMMGYQSALSPAGRLLADGTSRGYRVVDLSTGEDVIAFNTSGGGIGEIAFIGERLLAVCGDGEVAIHEVSTGRLVQRLVVPGDDDPYRLRVLPGGQSILVGTDKGQLLRFALRTGGVSGDASRPAEY